VHDGSAAEPEMEKTLPVKKCITFLTALLFVPGAVFGISESDFTQEYDAAVLPFFESFESGSFSGVDDIRISYVRHEVPEEAGALVILHGKSESRIKYAELAYDLRGLGYSLYLMDHRGMGFSERIVTDDTQRVHVDQFSDYVSDLKRFVDTVVNSVPHRRLVFLSHSMGGLIAALYLEQYPGDVDAAVLSAPMLRINTGSYPEPVAFLIASLGTALGLGREYALGQGPRQDPVFETNTVTHSRARWSLWEETLIPAHPEIKSGGTSYCWVRNSLFATWTARLQAGEVAVPVLLFQAGEDTFVKPDGQDDFCSAAGDCREVYFDGARHEILMETDAIRDRALAEIIDFLEE